MRLLPLLAVLAACSSETDYAGAFVVPSALGLVPETVDDPFGDEPIAYAASRFGGDIHALAVQEGRFLTDDPDASFLRAPPLATGEARVLTAVAPWVPAPDRLEVFAADQAFRHLLQVPHVTGVEDGVPRSAGLIVGEPVASGGGSLVEIDAAPGFVGTETWTLTSDGEAWWVEGSRSGKLPEPARPGETWTSPDRGLSLVVEGTGADGDTLTFETDAGIVEHDLDATPVALATAPDQSLLAVATSRADTAGGLLWWDPVAEAIAGEVDLPEASRPVTLDWSEGILYAADAGYPAVWALAPGEVEPVEIALPWPVLRAVADPGTGLLWVVPVSGTSVWAYDLATSRLRDLNPWRDGVDGLDLKTPIRGLAPVPVRTPTPETNDAGVNLWTHVLAVSTYAGPVYLLDQIDGCLIKGPFGPRSTFPPQALNRGDYGVSYTDVADGAYLERNPTNDRHVVVNDCAGIARTETWTLTFDSTVQAWRVEGSRSGPQDALAFEDVRYLSDDGEVSFRIRAGAAPSQDGWVITFQTDDGSLEIVGDRTGDGQIATEDAEIPFALPGAPLALTIRPEPLGGGWSTTDRRAVLLVPLEGGTSPGSDAVVRVDVQTGLVGAVWQ